MSQNHRFLEKLHLYTAASMGTFLLKNTHVARNACRKSCDRREKIIAEFAKRGSSQISPAFLKAAEERWTKKTQDGAKGAKTVLEASGEPSELRS